MRERVEGGGAMFIVLIFVDLALQMALSLPEYKSLGCSSACAMGSSYWTTGGRGRWASVRSLLKNSKHISKSAQVGKL